MKFLFILYSIYILLVAAHFFVCIIGIFLTHLMLSKNTVRL